MANNNTISLPIDQGSARLLMPAKVSVPASSNEDKLKKAFFN